MLKEKLSWLSENGYHVLLDRLQDGIFAVEEGRLIYVNQCLADMLGDVVDKLIGCPFIEMVAPDDRHLVLARHQARLAGMDVPEQYDMRLLTVQGAEILCSLNVGLGENKVGGTVTVGSVRDVTLQRAAQAELEKSKADLKYIFDNIPDVLYRTDMRGIITVVSPSCVDLLGYQPEELLGIALADYYENPAERQIVAQAVADGRGKAVQFEVRMRRKNGAIIWVSANISMRYELDGTPAFIEGVARNISERKEMEEQLRVLSRVDGLTGAYNRRYFIEKSEEVINTVNRYRRSASLIVADLDHFKKINDNYGHHAGDISLKAFVDACKEEIRQSDILGRLGGEEFGLMLPETSIQDAKILAERIRQAVNAINIQLGNQTIKFTASIGLVELGVDNVESIGDVMHRADVAMYQAKMRGRNQVVCS